MGGVTPLFAGGADAGALGGFLSERLEENTWKGGGRLFASGGSGISCCSLDPGDPPEVPSQGILQGLSCRNLHVPS